MAPRWNIDPLRTTKIALWVLGICVVAAITFVAYVLSDGLPTLDQLEDPRQDLATQVYSSDGVLLEHFATTRRTYTPYDSIPQSFVHALIATEDREFYNHWGVHAVRIVKAAVKNVLSLRTKEGASTITQQLARNLYFSREQTMARKVREAWTAFQIERTYTKNEILEMYSNTVYYGRGAYGIRVASQVYFNKEPMKLTVAESAYLVGLFKAPEKFGQDDSAGISRRNLILGMMHDEGYITGDVLTRSLAEPLVKPTLAEVRRGIAPHFVETIRQLLGRDGDLAEKLKGHDLYRDGLVIYTTLDSRVQRYANDAVQEHLTQYQRTFEQSWSWKSRSELLDAMIRKAASKRSDYIAASPSERVELLRRFRRDRGFVDSVKRDVTTIQTGVVVLDVRTGAILGMVGASPQSMKLNTAARYSLNHASQIRRQPGSSFKPFVYASALQHGLTPDSKIESGPFSKMLEDGTLWAPRGSSKNGGPMPLRTALKFSTNSVAARLITEHTTPSDVVTLCRDLGITSPMVAVPALCLGTSELSPLEITSAYAAFGNEGVHVSPTYITRIEDRMGNVLYQARMPAHAMDAIPDSVATQMLSMMQGVVDGGTASSVRRFYKGPAAGKTGTTNDFADAWFVGLTPDLACGVWVGFDDRRIQFTGDYGQGGRAAAPVFGRLMQRVYADQGLPWRRMSFTVARDSTDTVSVEMMRNPPSDQILDDLQDTIR